MMAQNDKMAKANLVQTKYTNELMNKKHVVGVGIGQLEKTGEIGLVVMVDKKVPLDSLEAKDQVPKQLEGVPVEVREIGTPRAF
jgi:hypothetical protein